MIKYRKHYSAKGSRNYVDKMKADKNAAEMLLIQRAMKLVPQSAKVLDAPCGGGRVMLELNRCGYQVTGADVSDGMLEIARKAVVENGLNCSVDQQDLERLTYSDQSFDAVICFRLFHHIPDPALRRLIISELCRVAKKHVLLSYFSPWSITSMSRRFRAATGLKKPNKWATSLDELKSYFAASGFRLTKDFARLPLIHTLHLGVWSRKTT